MDQLTQKIIRRVEGLPARKKAAVLELLREEGAPDAPEADERSAWKASLLDLPAWTDEELHDIEEVRIWLNQWTPKSW